MKSPKGRDTTGQFERGNRFIGRLQFMAARREFLRAAAIETDDWGGPGGALHALYLQWCRSKEPALLEPLAQEARRVRSLIAPAERAQGSPRETAARGVFMLTTGCAAANTPGPRD